VTAANEGLAGEEAASLAPSIPLELARLIRRSGWRSALIVASCVGVGLVIALLWPPYYEAVAAFAPERGGSTRNAGGVSYSAGQFALSLAADPSQSAAFYADLLVSRRVLQVVLEGQYPRPASGTPDSASLLTILRVGGRDSSDILDRGLRVFRRSLSIATDPRTNIVTVRFSARDARVAALAVNRLVQSVNAFNTGARQSQAQRRREFIEQQVDSVERALSLAEGKLKDFYSRNRTWSQSPGLEYTLGQLQRQVDIVKEVFLQLQRDLEAARIAEVDNVPLISVIDFATPPTRRAGPKRAVILLVSLVVGVGAVLMRVYFGWFLARSPQWAAVLGKRP
jgi:uncharacterized protein involved in exopolysaccharide biosynthesis